MQQALADLARPEFSYGKLVLVAASVLLVTVFLFSAALIPARSHAISALIAAAIVLACAVTLGEVLWRRAARRRLLALAATVSQLRAAQAAADESNRAQARFLATTSHEIRTPMNGVLGMLGLLLETDLTPEQRNYASTAAASGRVLLSIVDEILDTSKAGAASDTGEAAPVDIVALVEHVTELLAARAHAKGIAMSGHVEKSVPPQLVLPENRLRQILYNLCGNAIKFTERGGVGLYVAYQSGELRITVADTGIGMTRAEQNRIFRDFVQANAETRRIFGGTGLGLAISKRLTEALGGRITLTSAQGQGSTFVVAIPCQPAADASAVLPKGLEGLACHIAIPEGWVRQHLAATLLEEGAKVLDTGSAEALERVLWSPDPATLICDVKHASTLTRWAAAGPQVQQGKRVLVLLGAEERRQHTNLLAPPFAGYLLKPFRRATLVRQLTAQAPAQIDQAIARLRGLSSRGTAEPVKRAVLLAEDNPVNALLARTMLERAGCTVTHVVNGRLACQFVEAGGNADLIIMDVEMPEMDGLAATRFMRAREAAQGLRRLPILALTANARREDLEECLAAGMDGHLSKPFDRQDLDEVIQQLMSRRPAA